MGIEEEEEEEDSMIPVDLVLIFPALTIKLFFWRNPIWYYPFKKYLKIHLVESKKKKNENDTFCYLIDSSIYHSIIWLKKENYQIINLSYDI